MVESGGLVRLMVRVLRDMFSQGGCNVRQRFRLVLEKAESDPLRKEAFLKFIFLDPRQGVGSFLPLSKGRKILIGMEVFRQLFGEGEKFDRPAFSRACNKARLSEEEIEFLEVCVWD